MSVLPKYRDRCARRGFRRDEQGSMLIEFTISVWLILLVTFLIFEFSMTMYTYAVLGNAAREAVRYAVVHGTDSAQCSGPDAGCADSGGTNVTAVVRDYASISFHDMSSMQVTAAWPDGSAAPSKRVIVTVSYPYLPYLFIPGFSAPTMQVTAEGRIVF